MTFSALLIATLVAPTAAAGDYGMTWAVGAHDDTIGVDTVSCWAGDGCDAYSGDTVCSEKLPVLCIAVDGAANPGVTTTTTTEWAYGHLATTRPIRGVNLDSLTEANELCELSFGDGWRMAEFHDGAGWGLTALGYVRTDIRFWVHINDQPANCWD